MIRLITNGKKIKEHAKTKGLKVYEVAMIMDIAESTLYETYMHSMDEKKLNKVIDAIDAFVEKAGAMND